MAPKKAARIGGRKGITSSAHSALGALPVHKRNYVKVRASGGSVAEASNAAGVSSQMGRRYDSEADVQKAYRELVRKAIPAEKLVRLIKGGCEAKMPVYSSDGKKVTERADWKTRKPYIDMAARHGGYHEDKNANGSGTAIIISVNHIGQSSERTKHIIEASTEAN